MNSDDKEINDALKAVREGRYVRIDSVDSKPSQYTQPPQDTNPVAVVEVNGVEYNLYIYKKASARNMDVLAFMGVNGLGKRADSRTDEIIGVMKIETTELDPFSMLDFVHLKEAYRGRNLCSPFVQTVVQEYMAQLQLSLQVRGAGRNYASTTMQIHPKPGFLVFVDTFYPRKARACYISGLESAGFSLVSERSPDMATTTIDKHAFTMREYETYVERAPAGIKTWAEKLMFIHGSEQTRKDEIVREMKKIK